MKSKEPESGVLTERMDTDSPEFTELKAILLNESRAKTQWQKNAVELAAIRIQMEDYLKADTINKPKSVGDFLNSFSTALNIKQKKLANYIDIAPSNLNKIIKGERQINSEFALKIGKIFGIDPMLLLEIQLKNEFMAIAKYQHVKVENFSLKGLLEESAG